MSEEAKRPQGISNSSLQIVVIILGLLVFTGVFFADKTNLNNKDELAVSAGGNATQVAASAELEKDSIIQPWVDSLNLRKGKEKLPYLDTIVVNLQARKKFALASDYAIQRIESDSSLSNLRNIADLSREAVKMEKVQRDTSLFRRHADRRVDMLRIASLVEPENQEVLMDLGMALIESQKGQNSMQGILTIRKILEINPDNVDASYQLGLFSLQTGQFARAVQRFEKVLTLEEDNDNARYQLAYASAQIGEKEKARRLLDEIINRNANAQMVNLANSLKRSL
ncbi:MAG: tetratricopeptide repeat protein [Bacteroidota bacterium]